MLILVGLAELVVEATTKEVADVEATTKGMAGTVATT